MPETGHIEAEATQSTPKEPDFLSKSAQFFGDFLADSRPKCARLIASQILSEPDYQSTGLAAATALVAAGDLMDGRLIRFAVGRNGTQTTPEGARKDDLSDKAWSKILLEAQMARALMNKDYPQALFLFANKTILDTRDEIINELRDEAQELGVDVKAGPWGKRKTGLQNATFTLKNSLFTRHDKVEKTVYASQATATALSVYSGIVTGRRLKKGIAAAKAKAPKIENIPIEL